MKHREPAAAPGLAATIEAEIRWFEAVLDLRFRAHAGQAEMDAPMPSAPPLSGRDDAYAALCRGAGIGDSERLILILALIPSLRPRALDPLLIRNQATDRCFTEFGGIADDRGFRPTRETALFLLAGEDMGRRLAAMTLFAEKSTLVRHALIAKQPDPLAPWMPLDPHPELLAKLIAGARNAGDGA